MSNNYHSGTNSLATPRIQSSQNYAQTLLQQAKTHRSESKYSENSKERKSPISNILTSPKYQQENCEIETREENVDKMKNGYLQQVHVLSGKDIKRVSQSAKENIQNNKAISPLKQESNPSKKSRKAPANVGPLVIINEYETGNTSRHKPNSAKSMSLQRDAFHQHLEAGENWLSNKIQSTRNPVANDTSGHKVQSLDLGSDFKSILRRHQQSTTDLHNIWPEAKKAKKVEILSHRDNLETPRDNDLTNKSDPKHLDLSPIRSSHAVVRHKKSHTGGSEKEVRGIVKHKMVSPKGSIGEKELSHIKLSAREHTSHLLSPQNFDHRQHHSRGLSLRNSCQDDLQKGSITRDSINLNHHQKLDLPFISKYDMASPNSLQNNDYFSNKISMSPSQTPIMSGTTTEEVRPHLHLRLGKKFDINVHTSLGRPLNFAENNIKSNRDSEVQFEPYSMMSGDQIFSTRSALDRCDNRLNIAASASAHQGIKEPQRIYSHANTNKNTPIQDGENKNPVTQEIINELLKRTNSKETFVNPNAKFLLLRKQVQEKRGKSTFKSADWTIPNSPNNDICHFQEGSAEDSSKIKQTKTPEPTDNPPLKNQLEQLVNKTKLMMKDFRHKENKWEKEKEALVTEIRHLRSIIENL